MAATPDAMASSLGIETRAPGTRAAKTEAGISSTGGATGRACATAAGGSGAGGAGGT